MSQVPRERIVEVALAELLRRDPRPDYAGRVRRRWEAQRARPRPTAPRRNGPRSGDGTPDARERRTPGRRPWAAAAAAAVMLVVGALAWLAWRAADPMATPETPVASHAGPTEGPLGAGAPTGELAATFPRTLAPGLEALPAAFGEVIANPTDKPLEVALAAGERIELGPLAVLALESTSPGRSMPDRPQPRPLPRLLDGAATFLAPPGSAPVGYRYGLGNSPAPLELAAGGRFRAELARASGPHPLDVEDPLAPQRTFGRGRLLGPTWLTIEPLAGGLAWLDPEGRREPVEKPFEGRILDAEGTASALPTERRALLDKLCAAVAPVPGVEPLPEPSPRATWQADRVRLELAALLAEEPALWVPAARELERRVRSHAEPHWWRGAHALVARSADEAAPRVARRWWRDAAERFDTDALLALAEAGHEPFLRELAALLAGNIAQPDERERRERLRRGGPDADVDLLALAALARGDQRQAGRALDLTERLTKLRRDPLLDDDAARALLAAALLARAGLAEPWEGAVPDLLAHVGTLAAGEEAMSGAYLAAHLDVAASSASLAPYDVVAESDVESEREPGIGTAGLPRLAYFEQRVRERTWTLLDEVEPGAGRPKALDAWLETWRRR